MVYALERESNLGSTFAVLVELSEGRDVGSGPVSRVSVQVVVNPAVTVNRKRVTVRNRDNGWLLLAP
jgi:hypothetical protein